MIQGVEFMNGSYLIVSDELWQWSQDANENYCLIATNVTISQK